LKLQVKVLSFAKMKDLNGADVCAGDLVEPLVAPYGVRRVVAIVEVNYLTDSGQWKRQLAAELDHGSYVLGQKMMPVRLASAAFRRSDEKATRCSSDCFCDEGRALKSDVELVKNRAAIVELLRKIARAEGVFRLDHAEHMNNVIVASVESAREALKLMGENVDDIIVPPLKVG
jgi:hypothetical protein